MTSLNLTRAQKAAAILVAMGKPSASRLLKFFKQEELKALIEGARLLKTIPQGELERIVAEFEAEFMEGAGQLDSADQIDDILNDTLSPEEVQAIMGQGKTAANQPPPVWSELDKLEPARIAAFLAGEHSQTSALILSKVAPGTAANALLALDKPLRGEVVKRMMSISNIPEAATRLIETQLRSRVLGESNVKDTSAGQSRVANLLNEMDKPQLDEVMQDLEAAGTPDLEAVRARLFSFEDIPLLAQRARVTLFDGLSTELVTLCLRQAPPHLAEAVLSAIGARSRRMIEAELSQGPEGIQTADILRARKTVAATALRLSRDGVIELPSMQAAA
ncbi:flagellar motor switch protein FliG [Kumtagia ephedrae]|jgi:flagellar motor switch protein FliG|uniref:Flagellar motor switch protein FliG n=1 Tax=Kumtagia ephedrae TaxID=2116701 RepID=A0A2P7SLE4_9HYPH|nr:flagellar motor switch protein FliG [Mesorhizobium ephedrae]PSJ63320.1 flagellar motor switch protein FliG [Mesorhizobium ephedrae]